MLPSFPDGVQLNWQAGNGVFKIEKMEKGKGYSYVIGRGN